MNWKLSWFASSVVATYFALESTRLVNNLTQASPLAGPGWTTERKLAAREETRKLWYHGFDNYMHSAFPHDELTPLSCVGRGPNWKKREDYGRNDVCGNVTMTLIDVLDTFVVLDDRRGFEKAVRNIIETVSFNQDTKPQVFEVTIRILGGLLSGHTFANQSGHPFHLPWYHGELLELAHELGERLLVAFDTPTGIPVARVNLRHGMVKGETRTTCTAGAGTLILEFATLGRLTGDERFEKAAYKAFFEIWNRKSSIGLVGNEIDSFSGKWLSPELSGIGAGIDSFYEHAFKWYILSGESEFLDVWDEAYAAVMQYSRSADGFWYRNVNMYNGGLMYNTIDSLSAFWPGLQVLSGDIPSAIKLHMLFYNIWKQNSGLPEIYDSNHRRGTSFNYPLRPELIESTWYLYRATRDPFYLDVGERFLADLTRRAKVDCGLASVKDLRTSSHEDRMESFVLSETLKYLFLLFDEDNFVHHDDSNYVFTTEAHLLRLGSEHMKPASAARRKLRGIEGHQCPVYTPPRDSLQGYANQMGLARTLRDGPFVDYARVLIGLPPTPEDIAAWSPNGWCAAPHGTLPYSYNFVWTREDEKVVEDPSPNSKKLTVIPSGFLVHDMTGVRIHVMQRTDGSGYDIRKLGQNRVRPGQTVYIKESGLMKTSDHLGATTPAEIRRRDADVQLQFSFSFSHSPHNGVESAEVVEDVVAFTSTIGANLATAPYEEPIQSGFARRGGVLVYRDPENILGCELYKGSYPEAVLVVRRGQCTFLEKLINAKLASAVGVVVIGNDDFPITATARPDELEAAGDLTDVVIVTISRSMGMKVESMLDVDQVLGPGFTSMEMKSIRNASRRSRIQSIQTKKDALHDSLPLYIGHTQIVNARLLI